MPGRAFSDGAREPLAPSNCNLCSHLGDVPDKAIKVAIGAQGTIQARRRYFEPVVSNVIRSENSRQMRTDKSAILKRDTANSVNIHAQKPTAGGLLHLDKLVPKASHRSF